MGLLTILKKVSAIESNINEARNRVTAFFARVIARPLTKLSSRTTSILTLHSLTAVITIGQGEGKGS